MESGGVNAFVESLAKFESSISVSNPYAKLECRKNLVAYLEVLLSLKPLPYLFVGEAPGYDGCGVTGIPFTSEYVLHNCNHPFLLNTRDLYNSSGNQKEPTATIAWEAFEDFKMIPAFWNVFPFHPHQPNHSKSNRPPKSAEVSHGLTHLRSLVAILEPDSLIAVGNVAKKHLLKSNDLDLKMSIRHPSHGGKEKFRLAIEFLSAQISTLPSV